MNNFFPSVQPSVQPSVVSTPRVGLFQDGHGGDERKEKKRKNDEKDNEKKMDSGQQEGQREDSPGEGEEDE